MGLTYSIGGVSIEENSFQSDRIALDIAIEAPVYDVKRYHPAGADGNMIVRCGETAQRINCRFRYLATKAASHVMYRSNREAWANTAVDIIGDNNITYTGMNMLSFNQTSRMKSCGKPTIDQIFFDVEAVFTKDDGL